MNMCLSSPILSVLSTSLPVAEPASCLPGGVPPSLLSLALKTRCLSMSSFSCLQSLSFQKPGGSGLGF